MHNYISIYLQVSPIEKVRSGYEVLIVKEGTAISLHLNSGLMSVQKRTPISDKDTGNGKKERRYKIELARKSSHCEYIHRNKQEELLGQRFLNC